MNTPVHRFLITGPGRCGTHFFNEFFQRLGILSGHESFLNANSQPLWQFNDPTPEHDAQHLQIECSMYGAGRVQLFNKHGIRTIVLVRDPIDILNSMLRCQFDHKHNKRDDFYIFHTFKHYFRNFVGPIGDNGGPLDAMRYINAQYSMLFASSPFAIAFTDRIKPNTQDMTALLQILQLSHVTNDRIEKAYEEAYNKRNHFDVEFSGKKAQQLTYGTLPNFTDPQKQQQKDLFVSNAIKFGYHEADGGLIMPGSPQYNVGPTSGG